MLSFSALDQALDFYLGTLRFTLSDTIAMRPGVVATFTHVNPWHHSLALVRAQPESGPSLNHFMLEVADVDMVGRILDRVHEKGVSIFASLGRHTNDLMLSFYMDLHPGSALSTAPRAGSSMTGD